ENSSFIEKRGHEVLIRDALEALAKSDPEGRRWLGELNRRKAVAEYDEATMIARYAGLYGAVIGRPEAFV
ncbi:hypothetical protein, partial [Campylobacter coli]